MRKTALFLEGLKLRQIPLTETSGDRMRTMLSGIAERLPTREDRPATRGGGNVNDLRPPGSRPWRWGGGRDHTQESRAYFGVLVGILSVTMFFFPLTLTLFVLKEMGETWNSISLPPVVWLGTTMLLLSSFTLERSRRMLFNRHRFQRWWGLTLLLGLLFLGAQVLAWKQLAGTAIVAEKGLAQLFFYIFTGAHGVHLGGGILALLWIVWTRHKGRFGSLMVGRVQAAALYWHFMDGLWVAILALFLAMK